MLRRNGPAVKSVVTVLRLVPWWERFVKEVGGSERERELWMVRVVS